MNFLGFIPVAILGGLLGLDVVSFPQAMISRPIVASTLAGAFIGNGTAGVMMGVVLELIALDTLPFGASRYPEWGSASVVGGALFASQPIGNYGALPASLLAALLTASISGWSLVVLRKIIASRLHRSRDAIESGSRSSLMTLHLTGMTMDLVRGALVTFVALVVLHPLVVAIVSIWGVSPPVSRGVVVTVAAIVAAGALWKVFHAVRHSLWLFAAGVVAGAIILAAR